MLSLFDKIKTKKTQLNWFSSKKIFILFIHFILLLSHGKLNIKIHMYVQYLQQILQIL